MDTLRICQQCRKPLAAEAPQGLCPECLLKAGVPTGPTPVPRDTSSVAPSIAAPTPAELAAYFPQLEILELIGAGGMGMVYKARQPQLDRLVALKILSPEIAAKDDAFAGRFLREARALARLNHPNIVSVFDFGQAGPFFFFIMEFMDGANLRELITNHEITPREALGIVPRICDGLQFAHDEGVMHRDIKPENILLDRRGRVKIADFGLAKLIGVEPSGSNALTQSGVVMGTPRYMAPEQIEKPQTVDHRADIYSLGVVFYEMLTGELPLGRFEPPSHRVGVDVRLDEVVLRSLEKKPERRYQRVSEVKTDVETIAAAPSSRLAPPSPSVSASPPPDSGAAREKVETAATALFIVGLLDTLLLLVGLTAVVLAKLFQVDLQLGTGEIVPLTLGSLFGPVIMFGALRMRRLVHRDFAKFASVLAMVPITSPLFLVGIPVGIWCLKTLNNPAVKEAFKHAATDRLVPPEGTPVRPRFSRKAIVGAVWAALAMLALPSWFVVRPVIDARGAEPVLPRIQIASLRPVPLPATFLAQAAPSSWGEKSRPTFAFFLAVLLLVAGITAPVGTTVLGLVALHDIRHSKGMITGLPLALADAMIFPLVALGGLFYWLCHTVNRIARDLAPSSPLFNRGEWTAPAAVVLTLLVGTLLVWLAWRAAKKPVSA